MYSFLSLLAVFLVTTSSVPVQEAADEILAQLSNLRLDKNQIYSIRDITIRRDVLSVFFNRGAIAFLEPVEGQVTGAVFVGSGEVLAVPPDPVERGQIYKFIQSPILNERFSAALLRFTDDTYDEILEQYRDRAQEEVRAEDLEELLPWDEDLAERFRFLNLRLLADLLGPAESPFFFAELRGDNVGWFDLTYDERNLEEVVVRASDTGLAPGLPDIWASFNRRDQIRSPEQHAHENPALVDVLSYDIDATLSVGGDLEAFALVRLMPRVSGQRVLNFNLTRTLRLAEVTLNGEPIMFFQHPIAYEGEADQSSDTLVTTLPTPTEEGEELTLGFRYAGRVLDRRGEGIFYISERSFWYPSVGGRDPARYDTVFHYPGDNVLVATGRKVDEREENGVRHSWWTSEDEFFVAGFNYGDFSIESDETGQVPIDVYANNDIETVYIEIDAQRAVETGQAPRAVLGDRSPQARPDDVFSTRELAANILREVRPTVDFFSDRFGPYPFDRLTVSQFPIPFSEGWPSLLYVSTLGFFDGDQRERLGLDTFDRSQAEFVRAHEIAHQWFGNKAGWRSYRDQWMMEGLAHYAGAMYLEDKYTDVAERQRVLDRLSVRLLTHTSGTATHDDNGPLWLGNRLATAAVPDGYFETVYTKSPWVVHMLRMLMRDRGASSDDRFLAMVREFLDEFDGQPASTWDFKSTAERHMTERMNIEGDGTLDWFFRQWVFGTGVPSYEMDYNIETSVGAFLVAGRITQKEVTDFIVPVPVYARTDNDETLYLGDVVVSDDGADFFFTMDSEPAEILLDPYNEILKRP